MTNPRDDEDLSGSAVIETDGIKKGGSQGI